MGSQGGMAPNAVEFQLSDGTSVIVQSADVRCIYEALWAMTTSARPLPPRSSANDDSAVPQDRECSEHEGNRHRPQSREPDVVACRSVNEEVADGVDHGGERVVLGDRLKPA